MCLLLSSGTTSRVLARRTRRLSAGGTSWRAKVWQLGKARGEDGKEKEGAGVEWVDFGVSFVRLKKHKTTGSKRILARHSKTGILLW
jgi:hypothetical protein